MLNGEVARSTGLSASAIRFYEKQGALPRAARNAGGFRDHREEDPELLLFVRRLRSGRAHRAVVPRLLGPERTDGGTLG